MLHKGQAETMITPAGNIIYCIIAIVFDIKSKQKKHCTTTVLSTSNLKEATVHAILMKSYFIWIIFHRDMALGEF